MSDCSITCIKCYEPGHQEVNFGNHHKLCQSCKALNLKSLEKCLHCNVSVLIIKDYCQSQKRLKTLEVEEQKEVKSIIQPPIIPSPVHKNSHQSPKEKMITSPSSIVSSQFKFQEKTQEKLLKSIQIPENNKLPKPINPNDPNSHEKTEPMSKPGQNDERFEEIKENSKILCEFCQTFHGASFEECKNFCDFCLNLKEKISLNNDCRHRSCTECKKEGICKLCYDSKSICFNCSRGNVMQLGCGHHACKQCIVTEEKCIKCHKISIKSSPCSTCGSYCEQDLFKKCAHRGCIRCAKNDFCFKKKCLNKNFDQIKEKRNCFRCSLDKYKYLTLICGDVVCYDCFNPGISITKYVCWTCRNRLNDLKCDSCKHDIAWDDYNEQIILKMCCEKYYQIADYKEVKQSKLQAAKKNIQEKKVNK